MPPCPGRCPTKPKVSPATVGLAVFLLALWPIFLMVVLTLVLTGSTTAAGLNFTLASDMLQSPRDVSRVISMVAFGGNSFGLIAPIITGYIIAGTGGYKGAFIVAACLLACGAAATLTLTRRRVVPAAALVAQPV